MSDTLKNIAALGVGITVLFGLVGCSNKDDSSALHTIQYEGHSFILYDGGSYAGGITHHPDCNCHNHE
jgi:hypothetical protein